MRYNPSAARFFYVVSVVGLVSAGFLVFGASHNLLGGMFAFLTAAASYSLGNSLSDENNISTRNQE